MLLFWTISIIFPSGYCGLLQDLILMISPDWIPAVLNICAPLRRLCRTGLVDYKMFGPQLVLGLVLSLFFCCCFKSGMKRFGSSENCHFKCFQLLRRGELALNTHTKPSRQTNPTKPTKQKDPTKTNKPTPPKPKQTESKKATASKC